MTTTGKDTPSMTIAEANAALTAVGPGTTSTGIPACAQALTTEEPGSDMVGIPASLTSAAGPARRTSDSTRRDDAAPMAEVRSRSAKRSMCTSASAERFRVRPRLARKVSNEACARSAPR